MPGLTGISQMNPIIRKFLLTATACLLALNLSAQERLNVYLNFSGCYQLENETDTPWQSAFKAKYLRLELKGQLGDHLFYRLRHRLNESNARTAADYFSKATDIMMVGWQFNEKWSLMGGKLV